MSLPPLANLFALQDDDPSSLGEIASDLESSGEFADVWRPASGWVAAAAPLPRGESDAKVVRQHGLAFAEGRDRVVTDGHPEEDLRAVAELTDSSPERLASLPGDFGFIRFRPNGAATVVRSCGGLAPFYFWRSGHRAAIATRLGDLVRYLPDELGLDPLVNAVWASGRGLFPDGRTFLAGVSILERGHFAILEKDGRVNRRRYWNPRPIRIERPDAACAEEHARQLRAILIEKLTRELDPRGGNLLTLSGGVDSSSLGAVAAGVVGRKVWTFSLLPAPERLFEHEMAFIGPLARHYAFERSWSIRIHPHTRIELLHAGPRIAFHVAHPALCALPTIMREAPVSVLFGGEFADAICGSSLTLPDWIAHTSALALLRGLHELPSGPRDVLRWTKYRLRSLLGEPLLPSPGQPADFVRAELREQYSEWHDRRMRAAARDSASLRGLSLLAEQDGFVAMNWEAASALGVRRCFPFFNRDSLELAYRCHPAELVGPGPKKLLRRALARDVPAQNLHRSDKGAWGSYLRGVKLSWSVSLPEALAPMIRPDWYPSPPELIDRADAGALSQLTLFVESVAARRLQRTARGAPIAAPDASRRIRLDRILAE